MSHFKRSMLAISKVILCVFYFALPGALLAETKLLTLAVNSPGTPPHLYYNEELGDYDGVIPDLLRFLEQDGAISVEYIDSNRGRNELYVATGKFDMFYSSIAWLKEPEKLIATIPIFQHTSYLYSIDPFPTDFALNAKVKADICARRGFSYPALEPWFENGKLTRIDFSSHETMLGMLVLGKCNMAELNSKNMLALLNNKKFKGLAFYRYDKPTSLVPATLILNPSKLAERDMLNTYIQAFLESDRYELSLQTHLEKM